MAKTEQSQNNWVFLPVHKTRIIKELPKAILLSVDYNVSTILPKVFKRGKEDKDYIYFSLPQDFKVNIRVATQNAKTRRYEHTDTLYPISKLSECGMDKPYTLQPSPKSEFEKEIEEKVGENVVDTCDDTIDNLPF